MTLSLSVDIGFDTRAGQKPENQDAVNFVVPTPNQLELRGITAALADGVSSSEAAKIASQSAIQTFLEDFYATPDTWSTKHACQQVLTALNSWFYKQGNTAENELRGWVTTFDALIFKSTSAYLVHIGDARIYRLRDGKLTLLTKDHITWLSKERSYLSRALGIDTSLQIDFRQETLEIGDVFLMCTDGVYECVNEQTVTTILSSTENETQKAQKLVDKALSNGSEDNLTAQVITVKSLPEATADEVYQRLTELPFPPELEPGMKLDGYEILQALSLSARSQIYLAREVETQKQLVLKTPSANYSDDPWYLDGFVREEWLGQKLKHPGLMKTYRRARPKQFLYFTTEYIDGQSLQQWMEETPHPPLQTVRGLVNQIACALRALHRLDIIHQDLKPDNIMIDSNGRIKIIDFGAVHVASLAETTSLLERNHPEGTLHYTAPEYLLGEQGSNRSDLFSLGVIAYQMLTGHLPYKEKQIDPFNLKSYHHLHYISARDHRKELPTWVDSALKKACEPNPVKRYALLSEFTTDLTKPSKSFVNSTQAKPLMERNPAAFWKGVSGVLFILVLFQFYWITSAG